MKLKAFSIALVVVSMFSAILGTQLITVAAETTECYIDLRCVVDSVGIYFEVTDSPYLNITLVSTETIHVVLESIPGLVSFFIESNSSATSAVLTFGGFEASTTYYRYQDGDFIESFIADSSGGYTYTQDISQSHHIFVQENASTLYIDTDYTFTHDIYESIVATADDIVIDGNGYRLLGSGSGYGFYQTSTSSGVTIKDTTISGWSVGIRSGLNNIISGNTVSDCYIGVQLSVGDVVSDNSISDNSWGVYFWPGHLNTVSDNKILNNEEFGIVIMYSSYNTFDGNLVSGSAAGITFGWSQYNTFKDNIIISNHFGINFQASNNLIYHNDIIDNTYQTGGPGGTNDWYHGDLLEGNYWSDYPGADDGSGTGKHAIADDGIGDTCIPWPATGFDYYPFMNPLWWSPPTPEQAIQDLVDDVESMNLQQGIDNSLDTKLQNVLASLEALNAEQRNDAINKLNAFINEVEAQRGNKITNEQADYLITAAQKIVSLIEEPT